MLSRFQLTLLESRWLRCDSVGFIAGAVAGDPDDRMAQGPPGADRRGSRVFLMRFAAGYFEYAQLYLDGSKSAGCGGPRSRR
ncbi:MAG: hypothetical protein Ct9H300mP1_37450 [Planctomycetaceae bacterium]|nr:MAG: hypothetical protein Ct9H300mP1_37450 [Planctomycetaceae bacterium]